MDNLIVIDVETTGLNPYRHDRIVEVAAVCLNLENGISAQFTSLINPERDIGPISVHGLMPSDVIKAPRFAEIAAPLAEFMQQSAVLVGHNVRFDVCFLQSEYSRIGVEMPRYATVDTMALAGGGTLSACCAEHGIECKECLHSALNDACAAACLLQKMLQAGPGFLGADLKGLPPAWPCISALPGKLLPRDKVERVTTKPPSYLQRLVERLSLNSISSATSEGERDYRELLWRVLEDGQLDDSEGDSLVDMATGWGLTCNQVKVLHLDYLTKLVKAAWSDQIITDTERREIQQVAITLGFGQLTESQLQDLVCSSENVSQSMESSTTENWTGKSVCFTGECICRRSGELISRDTAEELATAKGLRVLGTVTKKLDVLVVADPNTQSGKAKKARQYGIRIIHEPVFWRLLQVHVD